MSLDLKRALPLAALLLGACSGARLRDQQKAISGLQAKSDALAVSLKDRSAELDAVKAAKADTEAKLADAETKLSIASARADSLEKSNKALSDSSGASQTELGARLNAIVAEKDELAKKLADAEKEKLGAVRLKILYRSARDKAVADHEALVKERDGLAAQFKELEQAKEREKTAGEEARQRRHDEMGRIADVILKEIQAGRAFAAVAGDRVEIKLSDALLFDADSAALSGGGVILLQRVGLALKELGSREIRVEAHDDAAPVKRGLLGGFADHWALSAARSAAAARVLQTRAGLDPARLSAVGDAEFHAVAAGDEACADGRCVVIVVEAATTP